MTAGIFYFLVTIIQEYGYFIIFFGTLLGGEVVILIASFLAFLGFFNIYLVLLISTIGIIISDSFWYWLGWNSKDFINRSNFLFRLVRYPNYLLENHFNHRIGKLLILSKFIYGTRTATLVASGYQRLPYRRFIYYNLISIFLWISIVVTLGYLMGFSWHYLERYNNYLQYFAFSGLIVLVVFKLIFRYFIRANKIIKLNNHHESGSGEYKK